MAVEEIDPETGEVKTLAVDPNDEIAALQAKLAALQAAPKTAPVTAPAADEVPPTEEEIDQKARAAAAAQAAASAATQKLSDQAKAAKPPARVTTPKTTAVAQAQTGGALAVAGDLEAAFLQHAGRGLHFEGRDLKIPRIQLLQDNSPQVKKGTMTYIQGAEAGMLFDDIDNVAMTSVFMVPVFYKRRFVAWKPRDEKGGGGGLVRPDVPEEEYKHYEEVSIGKRAYMDPKIGLVEVVDTPEWAVLISTDGLHYKPAVIAMAGTKAKIAARMNTLIMSQVITLPNGEERIPAPYSNLFSLSSKREGEGSEAYFNFATNYEGRVPTMPLFLKAADYYQKFAAGELEAAPMVQD